MTTNSIRRLWDLAKENKWHSFELELGMLLLRTEDKTRKALIKGIIK